jgi:glycerol 3-phosphatase-2
MPWAIDLDGVMWLGDQPIPGSAEAIARLLAEGEDVLFVTNNSSAPVGVVEAKLSAHGVDAAGRVVTSAMAAASLLEPGARALVVGGAGIVVALTERGVEVVGPERSGERPDAVVVGFTRAFDFDLLTAAAVAIRAGARLIGTNEDPTYPTPEGQIPGGGAILAAVATASETAPLVAGKPHRPLARIVLERLGRDGIMVGDRPSTDGAFARELGYRFALVTSGVTDASAAVEPVPHVIAADLATLVGALLDSGAL